MQRRNREKISFYVISMIVMYYSVKISVYFEEQVRKSYMDANCMAQLLQMQRNPHFYLFIQLQFYQLDSLKSMAFSAITTAHLRPLIPPQEENYFNPIRHHLKKASNKPKPIEQTPHHNSHARPPNSQKQLRFRDLSKDRPQYYTELHKIPSQNSFKELRKDTDFGSIRKRLFDKESTSTSRDKSISFSDIIRLSREKKLREERETSKSKVMLKKQQSSNKKGKAFNALKARLMGENNPNAGSIIKPPKDKQKGTIITQKPRPNTSSQQEQIDMVRNSTQFDCILNKSLQMTPI